jgi:hypothetical protein
MSYFVLELYSVTNIYKLITVRFIWLFFYTNINIFLRSWDRASLMYSSKTNKMQRYTIVFITIVSELELTHNSGKKQKKIDKYPMLCIKFWAPDDWRRNRLKHVEHL